TGLPFSFLCCVALRTLHSFPTRRSSDLPGCTHWSARPSPCLPAARRTSPAPQSPRHRWAPRPPGASLTCRRCTRTVPGQYKNCRSEEHTSELQSRENLVCRLLLEKKKNN